MQGADIVTVSQRWQARIAAAPEYTVVPHDNVFRMGMYHTSIGESSFELYRQYLKGLCRQYAGVPVEEAIPGFVEETDAGECYCIRSTSPLSLIGSEPTDQSLLNELRLVRGIGPKAMARLHEKGCRTISDLQYHRRWRDRAEHAISALTSGPAGAGYLVRSRLGPSHPLGLIASEGFNSSGLRFVDLETLGIFGRPVILFGVGCPGPNGITIHQVLLRSISEEPAALEHVKNLLEGAEAIVSYNGKSFDLPYLNERYAYYGFETLADLPHIDLLHYARRMWRRTVPDCRLSTIEKTYLNIERDVDITGMLVPEWYTRYRDTGNCGPLVPIVRHNQQDIASLPLLLDRLRRSAHECC